MIEQTARLKRTIAAIAAVLLGIVFLVSGAWKVLQPFQAGELLEQAKVSAGLGVMGAVTLGIVELFAAVLLFVPGFRRWGGVLGSALMIFFMAWIGYHYRALVGHECNCFPIIKRTVGPGFFIGDGIFLVLGLIAYAWSRPAAFSVRRPAIAFLAVAAFGAVSFGVNAAERRHAQIPTPVIVDGQPQNLATGRVFLFFYDPECSHCDEASKFLSTLNWNDGKIVAIPTHDPQFAADFLHDTHLKASTSLETAKLRKAFPFVDPPFGVALVDGQVKETFPQMQFNAPLPAPDLKKLGFVK